MNDSKDYKASLDEYHVPAFARRSIKSHAGFLLPYLKADMRVLDAGCGPGSITLGIAEHVAPGQVTGLDRNPKSLERARTLASTQAVTNINFEMGDIHTLPFEDQTFDLVFIHYVLQHLAEPQRALNEAYRVLRDGGIIAVADADRVGTLMFPADPGLDAFVQLLADLRILDGGTPTAGRQLRALAATAGFKDCVCTVVTGCDGDELTTKRSAQEQVSYLEMPAMVARITESGLATHDELQQITTALRAWGNDPGAVWTRLSFQVIGRR